MTFTCRLALAVACSLLPLSLVRAEADTGNPRQTPIVEVVKRARGAVVNIHSERSAKALSQEEFFALVPSQNRINGMGTGILIDPRGYIVTNHHVVEDVNSIRVRLVDGTTLPARVLARDPESDLAVIKVDAGKSLPVMPMGSSSDLMVGETVVAIGNAYGYEHTVTVGVISAIKRDVVLNKEVSYKQLIQTDASINPGNSGGPLLNVNGELIGVNVAIRAGAQGIGFAIPVDNMLKVVTEMMSARRRSGLIHGLVCKDRVEEAGRNGSPRRSLILERVDGNTPAALAKLQRDDVIVRVGDTDVCCGLDLERAFLDHTPGDKVAVVVRRNGTEQKVELALQTTERVAASVPDLVWKKLGVRVQAVNPEGLTRASQTLHGGLLISEVRADSAAGKAGVQKGDILVGLHQWEMLTPDNVTFVLTHADLASFQPLRFYIIRSGQVHRGWLQQLD